MKFLDGLDHDLKKALLTQLRNLWTHTSTALEGNTLTLGETAFVLAEGLTVSGKTLREHQEVIGHAQAIEILYGLLNRNNPITQEDLFHLHQAIQTAVILDIYQPVGAWKIEPNGTYAITENDQRIFIEYANPCDIPELMTEWLKLLNHHLASDALSEIDCINGYAELHMAFVRIHPFAEGNGRMARLLANLPVLKAGYPPIIINRESRLQYLRILAAYEIETGQAKTGCILLPNCKKMEDFQSFCQINWQTTQDLVAEVQALQRKRLA